MFLCTVSQADDFFFNFIFAAKRIQLKHTVTNFMNHSNWKAKAGSSDSGYLVLSLDSKKHQLVNKFLFTSFPLYIHGLIRKCLNSEGYFKFVW